MTYGCAEPIVPLSREGQRRKFSEADKRRIVSRRRQPVGGGAPLWDSSACPVSLEAGTGVAVEIADATPSTQEHTS
jgi:hypothetical protein